MLASIKILEPIFNEVTKMIFYYSATAWWLPRFCTYSQTCDVSWTIFRLERFIFCLHSTGFDMSPVKIPIFKHQFFADYWWDEVYIDPRPLDLLLLYPSCTLLYSWARYLRNHHWKTWHLHVHPPYLPLSKALPLSFTYFRAKPLRQWGWWGLFTMGTYNSLSPPVMSW